VLGAQSGLKDRNCHIVETTPPGLLRELAAVEVEDWTTLAEPEQRIARFTDDGTEIAFSTFVERLCAAGASVIAKWTDEDPLLCGAPAITRNVIGRGVVYYVGGYCPADAVEHLASHLLSSMKVQPVVEAAHEVEAIERKGFLSLFNHSAGPQIVRGIRGVDLLAGKRIAGDLELSPHGVVIVRIDG
jgi:beta-galactosidase GanA